MLVEGVVGVGERADTRVWCVEVCVGGGGGNGSGSGGEEWQ